MTKLMSIIPLNDGNNDKRKLASSLNIPTAQIVIVWLASSEVVIQLYYFELTIAEA